MIYQFPFDKVEKGSRVILYGIGDIGRQYLAQLLKNDHAKVVYAVDGLYFLTKSKMHDISVYAPGKIKETKSTEYDYVVISIRNEEQALHVRETLLGYGVSKDKIIWQIDGITPVKNFFDPEIRCWFQPTFSWAGEDAILYAIFRCIEMENPSYLDIGCNHPYEGNNTALFYLSGSRGVNIDASQKCIDLMNAERPDDLNLCMGINPASEYREFYMFGDTTSLNSFSKDYIDEYRRHTNTMHGTEPQSISVKCYTLQEVVNQFCNGKFPDLLDLDIEGLDCEVMASYDFSENGPSVIMVESWEKRLYDQLFEQGYSKYISTRCNSIFVRKNLLNKLIQQ